MTVYGFNKKETAVRLRDFIEANSSSSTSISPEKVKIPNSKGHLGHADGDETTSIVKTTFKKYRKNKSANSIIEQNIGGTSTNRTMDVYDPPSGTIFAMQDPFGTYWKIAGLTASEDIEINIKNNTGAQVDKFHFMAVDAHITDPDVDLTAWQSFPPTFNGSTPVFGGSNSDLGMSCVTQEDIANGATGRAKLSGMTPIKLYYKATNNKWRFVDIRNNTGLGEQLHHGVGEIFDIHTITGNHRWAWIRLGHYNAPIYRGEVNDVSGIAANGTGTVTIFSDSRFGSLNEDVTVSNTWMENTHDFNDNDELMIRYFRETHKFQIVSGECGT